MAASKSRGETDQAVAIRDSITDLKGKDLEIDVLTARVCQLASWGSMAYFCDLLALTPVLEGLKLFPERNSTAETMGFDVVRGSM